MWRYEELRLVELMRRRPGAGDPGDPTDRGPGPVDRRRERGTDLAFPSRRTRRSSWTRAGPSVSIEISRSVRPLLFRTRLLAITGILLGLVAFRTLRTAPLRMLRQALLSLSEEKERAQVTLRSIGDGVITTDARGRVLMLNNVAEDLTGWQHEDAREGRCTKYSGSCTRRPGWPAKAPWTGCCGRSGRSSSPIIPC